MSEPKSFQMFLLDRPALQNRDPAFQQRVYAMYLNSLNLAAPKGPSGDTTPRPVPPSATSSLTSSSTSISPPTNIGVSSESGSPFPSPDGATTRYPDPENPSTDTGRAAITHPVPPNKPISIHSTSAPTSTSTSTSISFSFASSSSTSISSSTSSSIPPSSTSSTATSATTTSTSTPTLVSPGPSSSRPSLVAPRTFEFSRANLQHTHSQGERSAPRWHALRPHLFPVQENDTGSASGSPRLTPRLDPTHTTSTVSGLSSSLNSSLSSSSALAHDPEGGFNTGEFDADPIVLPSSLITEGRPPLSAVPLPHLISSSSSSSLGATSSSSLLSASSSPSRLHAHPSRGTTLPRSHTRHHPHLPHPLAQDVAWSIGQDGDHPFTFHSGGVSISGLPSGLAGFVDEDDHVDPTPSSSSTSLALHHRWSRLGTYGSGESGSRSIARPKRHHRSGHNRAEREGHERDRRGLEGTGGGGGGGGGVVGLGSGHQPAYPEMGSPAASVHAALVMSASHSNRMRNKARLLSGMKGKEGNAGAHDVLIQKRERSGSLSDTQPIYSQGQGQAQTQGQGHDDQLLGWSRRKRDSLRIDGSSDDDVGLTSRHAHPTTIQIDTPVSASIPGTTGRGISGDGGDSSRGQDREGQAERQGFAPLGARLKQSQSFGALQALLGTTPVRRERRELTCDSEHDRDWQEEGRMGEKRVVDGKHKGAVTDTEVQMEMDRGSKGLRGRGGGGDGYGDALAKGNVGIIASGRSGNTKDEPARSKQLTMGRAASYSYTMAMRDKSALGTQSHHLTPYQHHHHHHHQQQQQQQRQYLDVPRGTLAGPFVRERDLESVSITRSMSGAQGVPTAQGNHSIHGPQPTQGLKRVESRSRLQMLLSSPIITDTPRFVPEPLHRTMSPANSITTSTHVPPLHVDTSAAVTGGSPTLSTRALERSVSGTSTGTGVLETASRTPSHSIGLYRNAVRLGSSSNHPDTPQEAAMDPTWHKFGLRVEALPKDIQQVFSMQTTLSIATAVFYNDEAAIRAYEVHPAVIFVAELFQAAHNAETGEKSVTTPLTTSPPTTTPETGAATPSSTAKGSDLPGDVFIKRALGAVFSRSDFDRRSPLHVAAVTGHLEILLYLLSTGVMPDTVDRWGRTPLDEALANDRTAVAAELRRAGAHTSAELAAALPRDDAKSLQTVAMPVSTVDSFIVPNSLNEEVTTTIDQDQTQKTTAITSPPLTTSIQPALTLPTFTNLSANTGATTTTSSSIPSSTSALVGSPLAGPASSITSTAVDSISSTAMKPPLPPNLSLVTTPPSHLTMTSQIHPSGRHSPTSFPFPPPSTSALIASSADADVASSVMSPGVSASYQRLMCDAAESGDVEILSFIFFRGYSLELANHEGRTPLHYAARAGRVDVVKLLLSLSASPLIRDHLGFTPLDEATKADHTEIIQLLERAASSTQPPAPFLTDKSTSLKPSSTGISTLTQGPTALSLLSLRSPPNPRPTDLDCLITDGQLTSEGLGAPGAGYSSEKVLPQMASNPTYADIQGFMKVFEGTTKRQGTGYDDANVAHDSGEQVKKQRTGDGAEGQSGYNGLDDDSDNDEAEQDLNAFTMSLMDAPPSLMLGPTIPPCSRAVLASVRPWLIPGVLLQTDAETCIRLGLINGVAIHDEKSSSSNDNNYPTGPTRHHDDVNGVYEGGELMTMHHDPVSNDHGHVSAPQSQSSPTLVDSPMSASLHAVSAPPTLTSPVFSMPPPSTDTSLADVVTVSAHSPDSSPTHTHETTNPSSTATSAHTTTAPSISTTTSTVNIVEPFSIAGLLLEPCPPNNSVPTSSSSSSSSASIELSPRSAPVLASPISSLASLSSASSAAPSFSTQGGWTGHQDANQPSSSSSSFPSSSSLSSSQTSVLPSTIPLTNNELTSSHYTFPSLSHTPQDQGTIQPSLLSTASSSSSTISSSASLPPPSPPPFLSSISAPIHQSHMNTSLDHTTVPQSTLSLALSSSTSTALPSSSSSLPTSSASSSATALSSTKSDEISSPPPPTLDGSSSSTAATTEPLPPHLSTTTTTTDATTSTTTLNENTNQTTTATSATSTNSNSANVDIGTSSLLSDWLNRTGDTADLPDDDTSYSSPYNYSSTSLKSPVDPYGRRYGRYVYGVGSGGSMYGNRSSSSSSSSSFSPTGLQHHGDGDGEEGVGYAQFNVHPYSNHTPYNSHHTTQHGDISFSAPTIDLSIPDVDSSFMNQSHHHNPPHAYHNTDIHNTSHHHYNNNFHGDHNATTHINNNYLDTPITHQHRSSYQVANQSPHTDITASQVEARQSGLEGDMGQLAQPGQFRLFSLLDTSLVQPMPADSIQLNQPSSSSSSSSSPVYDTTPSYPNLPTIAATSIIRSIPVWPQLIFARSVPRPFPNMLFGRPRAYAPWLHYVPAISASISSLLHWLTSVTGHSYAEYWMPSMDHEQLECLPTAIAISSRRPLEDESAAKACPRLSGCQVTMTESNALVSYISHYTTKLKRGDYHLHKLKSRDFHSHSCSTVIDLPWSRSTDTSTVTPLSLEAVCYLTRTPLHIANLDTYRPVAGTVFNRAAVARRCGFRSATLVPILTRNRTCLGVIALFSAQPRECGFTICSVCANPSKQETSNQSNHPATQKQGSIHGTDLNTTNTSSPSPIPSPSVEHVLESISTAVTGLTRLLSARQEEMDMQQYCDQLIHDLQWCSVTTNPSSSTPPSLTSSSSSSSLSSSTSTPCQPVVNDRSWLLRVLIETGVLRPLWVWAETMQSECHRSVAPVLKLLAELRSAFLRAGLWMILAPHLIAACKYLYAVSPRELVAGVAHFVHVRSYVETVLLTLASHGDVRADLLTTPLYGPKSGVLIDIITSHSHPNHSSSLSSPSGMIDPNHPKPSPTKSESSFISIYSNHSNSHSHSHPHHPHPHPHPHPRPSSSSSSLNGASTTTSLSNPEDISNVTSPHHPRITSLHVLRQESPVLSMLRSGHAIKHATALLLTSPYFDRLSSAYREDPYPPTISAWDLFDVTGPDVTSEPDLDQRLLDLCTELVRSPRVPISPSTISELHKSLTLSTDVTKGKYRTQPVVGSFMFYRFYRSFLPAEEVSTAMEILCETANSSEMLQLHPVVQAHYLFSTLVYFIHPFEDGNGRIGRLLGNVILRRNGYPWAIEHSDKILGLNGLIQKVILRA